MWGDLGLRFLIGGLIVSAFSLIGDLVRPQSFAGLFGAAPSVALATLGLTFARHGGSYASVEGGAMLAGAVALGVYNVVVAGVLMRKRWPAWQVAATAWLVWLGMAFGLWGLFLKGHGA
jgi:hypothetical protein